MATTTPASASASPPSSGAVPAPPLNHARIAGAEAVGTGILILGGVGTAVLAPNIGQLGIALAFGFSLLVAAYAVGPISGCHLNPAVTLAMFLARKIRGITAAFYILGQLIGGFVGAFLIWSIATGTDTYVRGSFDANGWAQLSPGGYGLGSVIVVEVVFTALLVFVILMTTRADFPRGTAPVAMGLTLTLIYFVTIPVDNTSVNPIRSLVTAVFAETGKDYLQQLWAFIAFPLLGGILGVFVWLFVDEARLEGTLLFNEGLAQARDIFDRGMEEVVEDVEKLDDPENNDPQLEDR